ncbi:hypothetical protein B9J07_27735 [Sinorhizobium sp. LM21]|uniref:hypothetical protein n=1 Tax=Sinorhizobium sp. LM21 TaxID=1449788 RepID=UPI000B5B5CBF|nr:hypothetical protein [Sinorhizobium sp. LM21]OWZ90381.1 hypothetical protein B9J07_27735 [Sinorhizobium sp. LM21]
MTRTSLNAMIAGFLANKGVITKLPDCKKAYPWATEQDWKDAISRHHAALELCGTVLQEEDTIDRATNLMTGREHSQVYAYYLGDDEDLSDVSEVDRASYRADVTSMTDMQLIGYATADAQLDLHHNDPEW